MHYLDPSWHSTRQTQKRRARIGIIAISLFSAALISLMFLPI